MDVVLVVVVNFDGDGDVNLIDGRRRASANNRSCFRRAARGHVHVAVAVKVDDHVHDHDYDYDARP